MKIVAMGDSITQGYPFTNQESWVEYLAQELKFQVLNQGICGDFTSGMCPAFPRTPNEDSTLTASKAA